MILSQSVDKRVEKLKMDTESTLILDAEGRLTNFSSALHLPPTRNVVSLQGVVAGTQLSLTIHSGSFSYTTECYLPPNALAGDSLSPQACLPGLRQGQTWSAPSYSPLRPPNEPIEILKAKVEGLEPSVWNGRPESVWLVVFRADPGFGMGEDKTVRGRLWVRTDGTVLRQQIMVFDCVLTFVRLADSEMAAFSGDANDE
jgi:hypothetical protein